MPTYRAIAEYYDPEYESADMLQRDVPFFMEHLPRRRQSILDLATGTARAAIPLAQLGHRITGVDYAADMLTIARRKRDAVGLTDKQLTLVKSDLLKLKLDQTFDHAVCFFNTFCVFPTIAQQDKLLNNIKAALKPRGRFWLDIYNPDPALLAQPYRSNMDPHLFYVDALERSVLRTTEVRQLPTPQLQRITHHYRWHDEQQGEQHHRVTFDLTWYQPRELVRLLTHHGFKIEHLYGDYNGSEVTQDSPRIICCGRLA